MATEAAQYRHRQRFHVMKSTRPQYWQLRLLLQPDVRSYSKVQCKYVYAEHPLSSRKSSIANDINSLNITHTRFIKALTPHHCRPHRRRS